MNKKNYIGVRDIIGLIIITLFGAYNTLGNFLNLPVIKDPILALFVGSVIFSFILILKIRELSINIKDLEGVSPKIRVIGIKVEDIQLTEMYDKTNPQLFYGRTSASPIESTQIPKFRDVYGSTNTLSLNQPLNKAIVIIIENYRPEGVNVLEAKNVSAIFSFFDSLNNKLYSNVDGKWKETSEPTLDIPELIPDHNYLEIDIPAGSKRNLYIAYKESLSNKCYLLNLETLSLKAKRDLPLPHGILFMELTIKGSNFDPIELRFRCVIPENEQDIELTIIEKNEEIDKKPKQN